MVTYVSKEKFEVGIGDEGISLEAIKAGETGPVFFPKYKRRAEVRALENIERFKVVLVVSANLEVVNHPGPGIFTKV